MSIERELLKEVLEYFDPLGLNTEHCGDLPERIKELLAQPEQEQKPVAWIIQTEVEGKLLEWVCTNKKHYMEEHDSIKEPIPLYTAPPKREPLSEDTMLRLISEHRDFPLNLVRAIEKAHGIGGGA